jgi:hypothetical protein
MFRKPKPKPKKNATKADNGNATKDGGNNTNSTNDTKSAKAATQGDEEAKPQEKNADGSAVEDEL